MKIISLKKVAEFGGGFTPSATSILPLFLEIPAGSNSVTDAQLVGATILLTIRELFPYQQVQTDPGNREFTHDPLTGELVFSLVNPTNTEQLYVLFYPSPASGITMATEPVTMQEIRTHLQIDYPEDDIELYRMNARCRQRIEKYCNLSIVPTRWELIASFDCGGEELPNGPVVTIEAVETRDPQGTGSYVSTQNAWYGEGNKFFTHYPGSDIFINSRWGAPWASHVRVVYTAGMDVVPEDLKLAILNEIAYRFEHKGNVAESGVCEAAKELAAPYVNYSWI